jgi:alkylated DNA repair protein (DNA oxidative demethylase)
MTPDLFAPDRLVLLAEDAVRLPGFAADRAVALLAAIQHVTAHAPWRHLVTPGGFTMSVAMSNCGALGWHSDRQGYRYVACDPISGASWPAMPDAFRLLATEGAAVAGFDRFRPDACLINRYVPGTRLSLHQDRDEADMKAPIVSVSLGLPAVFLFGGARRAGPVRKVPLAHGDVVVWGGKSRLAFHGVAPVAEGEHPLLGRQRVNLTFRKAG